MLRFKHLRLHRPLVVIDVETTGTNVRADRILQIAALKFAPHKKPVLFTRKVNPGIPIPPSATEVHGFGNSDLTDCPPFEHIARRLARFMDHADLAGFGLKRFDLPMLCSEFHRAGAPFSLAGRSVIDAMEIFHLHEKRDLQAAYQFYCGKEHRSAHRAGQDVRVTARVLDRQLRCYPGLPRSVPKLHELLTEVDLAGRFRRRNGTIVFGFGKYSGQALGEVAKADPSYLEWILASDFLDDVKELVRQALADQADEKHPQ